jgi:uncharacterized protein YuzE
VTTSTPEPERPPLAWKRDPQADAAYARLTGAAIARTVCAGPSVNFDVDSTGRPVGVEVLDGADWVAALVALFMRGEVVLVHGFDDENPVPPEYQQTPPAGSAADGDTPDLAAALKASLRRAPGFAERLAAIKDRKPLHDAIERGPAADGDICTDPLGDSWRQLQEAERQIDAEEVQGRGEANGGS